MSLPILPEGSMIRVNDVRDMGADSGIVPTHGSLYCELLIILSVVICGSV